MICRRSTETSRKIFLIIIFFIFTAALLAGESDVLLKEDFNSLSSWKPLLFPKIKQHSMYSIISENGRSCLRAETNASASGIIFDKTFNVYKYPIVKWRWKISNIFKRGNELKKSGDDYPVRIYIIFKYDPEAASFTDSAVYGAAKLIYGEYPPHSSLNYIWANNYHKERVIVNTYTDKAMMILLEAGASKAGEWVDEEINIIDDYKKAFGKNPPETAGLAIMSDSDNTGEQATAFVDFITVYSRQR